VLRNTKLLKFLIERVKSRFRNDRTKRDGKTNIC